MSRDTSVTGCRNADDPQEINHERRESSFTLDAVSLRERDPKERGRMGVAGGRCALEGRALPARPPPLLLSPPLLYCLSYCCL